MKLFDLSLFEFQLVRDGLSDWNMAPFISRGIIATELAIGVSAILLFRQRKFFLTIMLFFLILFSVYLIIMIVSGNSAENCGCFGEVIKMGHFSSLIKNVILIIVIIPASKFSPAISRSEYYKTLPLTLAVFSIIFILFPVKQYPKPNGNFSGTTSAANSPDTNVTIVLNQKTSVESKKSSNLVVKKDSAISFLKKYLKKKSAFSLYEPLSDPRFRFDEGEKLAFLLSLDCEHCQKALKDFSSSAKSFRFPQVGILFLGEESQVAPFFSNAGAEYSYRIISPEEFFPFLTKSPPKIFYLVNGNIVASLEAEEVEPESLISVITNTRKNK